MDERYDRQRKSVVYLFLRKYLHIELYNFNFLVLND